MVTKVNLEMKNDIELKETNIETEDINVVNNYLTELFDSIDDCLIKINVVVEESKA